MDIRKSGTPLEPQKVPSQETQSTPKQINEVGTSGVAGLNDALENAKLPDAFADALEQATDPRQAIAQDPAKPVNESAPETTQQNSRNAPETTGRTVIGGQLDRFESGGLIPRNGPYAWIYSVSDDTEHDFRAGFDVNGLWDQDLVVGYTKFGVRDRGEAPYVSLDFGFGAPLVDSFSHHLRVEGDGEFEAGSRASVISNKILLGADASLKEDQLNVGMTLGFELPTPWGDYPVENRFDVASVDVNEVKKGAEDLAEWVDEVTPDSVDQFVSDSEHAAADAAVGAVQGAADAAQGVADTLQSVADGLENLFQAWGA